HQIAGDDDVVEDCAMERLQVEILRHAVHRLISRSPNGKDQRLAALWQAITHDDARESFASCGSAYSRPWTLTSQAD
ncbi:MAG: hypothetical protein KGQ51_18875, partial [Planctomycetes bacterium]|nr:hypothetical protein [Planctomycetota bacterium]